MTEKKQFKATLDDFHEYLIGILNQYQNAIPVLKKELAAITEDQLDDLNDTLKSQQALLLQTKNFGKKVTEYLSQLNISAKNLTEMVTKLPEEEQMRFFNIIGEFDQTVEEVNFYKDKCRTLLQSKLYGIGKILERNDIKKENMTYDQNASEIQSALFPKAFEKKI